MPLAMEVGLGPGDFVLDGDPASPPPKGGGALRFSAAVYCGRVEGGNEGEEGRRGGRTLISQISSECVHCVDFRWPKSMIFGNF